MSTNYVMKSNSTSQKYIKLKRYTTIVTKKYQNMKTISIKTNLLRKHFKVNNYSKEYNKMLKKQPKLHNF